VPRLITGVNISIGAGGGGGGGGAIQSSTPYVWKSKTNGYNTAKGIEYSEGTQHNIKDLSWPLISHLPIHPQS
jgi:hypothetical protein